VFLLSIRQSLILIDLRRDLVSKPSCELIFVPDEDDRPVFSLRVNISHAKSNVQKSNRLIPLAACCLLPRGRWFALCPYRLSQVEAKSRPQSNLVQSGKTGAGAPKAEEFHRFAPPIFGTCPGRV